MRKILLAACAFAALGGAAQAADYDGKSRDIFLDSMAYLSIAEKVCGQPYNLQALSNYISANVPSTDSDFGGTLGFRIKLYTHSFNDDYPTNSAIAIFCAAELQQALNIGAIKADAQGKVTATFPNK